MLWHQVLSIFKKNPALYIAIGLLILSLIFYLPSIGREDRLEKSQEEWEQRNQQLVEERSGKELKKEELSGESQQLLEDTENWTRRAEELESYLVEE